MLSFPNVDADLVYWYIILLFENLGGNRGKQGVEFQNQLL